MTKKTKRGGCFSNLLILLLLLGLAFGYVMYRYNESPSQAWRRIVDSIERLVHPKPAPELPVAPTATPFADARCHAGADPRRHADANIGRHTDAG